MGLFEYIHSSSEIEDLAVRLALLYIEKSDKPISDPKEIANEFVNAQNAIVAELKKFT